MPTGNGGITQGLALRLTNMEQGRREVTANQFRREQMDAMNEQRKAAADYRKALAEQKEAARQEKQISELQKTINVKGLHPIYQDVANRESAEFISRTIEGMKKVPNYTTSGEYLQDKDKVMGHQNMRIASSTNIFNGEKKVTKNADDYELQSDMYDAMQGLDYNAFIKANGGSDYVMADGNIQPKFNRAKVEAAMIKGSTEGEPIIDVPSEVGGFSVIKQKQPPNPEKLQALRDSYMDIIANSGMNNKDFIKQAEQIDEVYQSIKKSENFIGEKTLKRSRSVAEELALSQGKLNQKAAYNATKAANANKFKATKRAGGTTYTSPDVIIDDDVAGNGNIVIYKTIKNTTAVPMIPMPEGAMVENDKGMWDKKDKITEGSVIVNPQYHFLKNGQMVLYGEIETLDTQLNKKVRSGLKRILMPNDPDLAPLAVSGINGQTKNALNVSFDTATGKYSYDIDEERTEAQPKGGGNSTSGNKTAPTNTKPAGGGTQPTNTQAAPASNLRADGTVKGKGYFGELKMQDGSNKVATEISIGVQFDGKETEIPTLVPTLTNAEKNWLLKGNNPNDKSEIGNSIVNKAIDHAVDRRKRGLSPFKDGGGQKKAAPAQNVTPKAPTTPVSTNTTSNAVPTSAPKDQKRDWAAEVTLPYERTKGAKDGTGLAQYNNVKSEEVYNHPDVKVVEDLPEPLRVSAGDFGYNSEDPRASLMVAAGVITAEEKAKLYTNGKLDKKKVDEWWDAPYNESLNTGKGDVLAEYNKDPKGFISKFGMEKLRSYANTNDPDGKNYSDPSSAYSKTWKPRVNEINKYIYETYFNDGKPKNSAPAGGGQKKAAPKKGKATKPFNNSLNIQ